MGRVDNKVESVPEKPFRTEVSGILCERQNGTTVAIKDLTIANILLKIESFSYELVGARYVTAIESRWNDFRDKVGPTRLHPTRMYGT